MAEFERWKADETWIVENDEPIGNVEFEPSRSALVNRHNASIDALETATLGEKKRCKDVPK